MEEELFFTDEQVYALFWEWTKRVWPRIQAAANLHNVARDETRLRVFPWPHVARYNAFVAEIVRAEDKDAIRITIAKTPKPIIRRLDQVARMSFLFPEIGMPGKPARAMSEWARETIIAHLQVDDYASPLRWIAPPWPERELGWRSCPLEPGAMAPSVWRRNEAMQRSARRAQSAAQPHPEDTV